MTADLQLFDALDAATEAALRSSIERFGVLVPVITDQHGRILDGHHRSRLAAELGVEHRVDVVQVADDAEAEAIARTLNTDRRHLTIEQRRVVVADLREQGHPLRAIAGAVGVSKDTVARDLEIVSPETIPDRVQRQGGGSYPTTRPAPIAVTRPDSPDDPDVEPDPIPGTDRLRDIRDELAEATGTPYVIKLHRAILAVAVYSTDDDAERITRYLANEPPATRPVSIAVIEQAERTLAHVKAVLQERRMEVVQ